MLFSQSLRQRQRTRRQLSSRFLSIDVLEDRNLLATAITAPFDLATTNLTSKDQFDVDVAMLNDGRFIAVWEHQHGPGDKDIYYRVFNANGTAAGGFADAPVIATANNEFDPRVAAASDGRFVVTWTSTGPDDDNDVFFQLFDAAGNKSGPVIQVGEDGGRNEDSSDVGMADDGTFVVVYEETIGGDDDIRRQQFRADGTPFLASEPIATTIGLNERDPVIAVAPNGRSVIAWVSGNVIRYQAFAPDGSDFGITDQTNEIASDGDDLPDVGIADDGAFIIVWQELVAGGNDFIAFQQFDVDGVRLGSPQAINSAANVEDVEPRIAVQRDGDFIITATQVAGTQEQAVYFEYLRDNTMQDANFVGTGSIGLEGETAVGVSSDRFVVAYTEGDVGSADVAARLFAVADTVFNPAPPALFAGFTEPGDFFDAGRLSATSFIEDAVLINASLSGNEPSLRVIDALTGEIRAEFSDPNFGSWTRVADRSLVGDVDGDGVDELIQFRRAQSSGGPVAGGAIRVLDIGSGEVLLRYEYDDTVAGTTFADLLSTLVDPEDEVFVGYFTQPTRLEALFFNRTSQQSGAASLRVFDLLTGALVDEGFHNGLNFGGWIDPTDEYTVSDTNFDGQDDIVIVNRVPNPEVFRPTNIGFVGMVSLNPRDGGRQGNDIGFYRFFDWNFSKPGEQSVFPGYDNLTDNATFGTVINNGLLTPVIVLVNSSSREQAAYALLEPAPFVPNVRDSFQLISTIFHSDDNFGSFDPDDNFVMADVTGDGSDEFLSYSKGSNGFHLTTFDAFRGTILGELPTSTTGVTTATVTELPSRRPDVAAVEMDDDATAPSSMTSSTVASQPELASERIDDLFDRGRGRNASADLDEYEWWLV